MTSEDPTMIDQDPRPYAGLDQALYTLGGGGGGQGYVLLVILEVLIHSNVTMIIIIACFGCS